MALLSLKYLVSVPRSFVNTKSSVTRLMSVTSSDEICSQFLRYEDYGEPSKVLSINSENISKPNTNQVIVKWLLSPVNPADINTIQGKYPNKPPLPAIPGNEGVGQIIDIGSGVKNLQIGDKIVPNYQNLGTWRTYAVYDSEAVFKIPKEVPDTAACMLNVNPCTAYRMLKDFVPLKPGDSIIQNGANSAVGQNVIQLCKIWGIHNVNIVRDRPNIAKLKTELKDLGATEVLTEDEVRTASIFKSTIPKPKLAFNCVGGKSALEILRHLDTDGSMVTYGGMSREPVTVPTSALIFKNISIRGFWASAWTNRNMDSKVRMEMRDHLIEMILKNQLKAPAAKLVPFSTYQEAVFNTLSIDGKTGLKFVLNMTRE